MQILKIAAVTAALLCAGAAGAVPAKPGLRTAVQPDGSVVTYRVIGDERAHYMTAPDGQTLLTEDEGRICYARLDGSRLVSTGVSARSAVPANAVRLADLPAPIKAPARVPDNMLTTTFPSSGTPRALVVLVEYTDVKFKVADPKAHFEAMLNEEGYDRYGAIGSARDYFKECSGGKFVPVFDVYGPVTLKYNRSYYGRNVGYGDDQYAHRMAIEACGQLDGQIDFTVYDTDADGFIDNVYVFYAGMGEADSSVTNSVWPHSHDIEYTDDECPVFDGVTLNHYATSNELEGDYSDYSGDPAGISTFCHEFSHVLGLPDIYATSYTTAYTPGEWDLMDSGTYNASGHIPPYYTAFERLSMHWIEPRVLTEPDDIVLRPISTGDACLIPTGLDNEFFLLENRQLEGYDVALPGHGMLIWHIDYRQSIWDNNRVNNTASHQYVDLEEADNSQSNYKSSRAAEPFPGTRGVTSFTDDTKPGMLTWGRARLETPITDITEGNGNITFKVKGGKTDGIGELAAIETGVRVNGRNVIGAQEIWRPDGTLVGRGTDMPLPAAGIYILVGRDGSRHKVSVR